MLIGLNGYARVGKDSVANVLVEEYGYQRVGLADKMKDALYALNPWITPRYTVDPRKDRDAQLELKDRFEAFPAGAWQLQMVVDKVGWDVAKELPEVRGLLQRLGTEVGRNILGEDMWIHAAFPGGIYGRSARVVVSDVRFDNEARWVRDHGGVVVEVKRPGYGPLNGHASEAGVEMLMDDWRLENDGRLDDLKAKVGAMLRAINQAISGSLPVGSYGRSAPMTSGFFRNG